MILDLIVYLQRTNRALGFAIVLFSPDEYIAGIGEGRRVNLGTDFLDRFLNMNLFEFA